MEIKLDRKEYLASIIGITSIHVIIRFYKKKISPIRSGWYYTDIKVPYYFEDNGTIQLQQFLDIVFNYATSNVSENKYLYHEYKIDFSFLDNFTIIEEGRIKFTTVNQDSIIRYAKKQHRFYKSKHGKYKSYINFNNYSDDQYIALLLKSNYDNSKYLKIFTSDGKMYSLIFDIDQNIPFDNIEEKIRNVRFRPSPIKADVAIAEDMRIVKRYR